MEYRSIKLKIESPEHSVAVQEFLFEKGCRWNFDGQKVKKTDAKYLFVEASGAIGWDNSDSFFNDRRPSYKEVVVTFVDMPRVAAMQLKERPRTVLFGKTYFTDELEARLAGLEVASGRS